MVWRKSIFFFFDILAHYWPKTNGRNVFFSWLISECYSIIFGKFSLPHIFKYFFLNNNFLIIHRLQNLVIWLFYYLESGNISRARNQHQNTVKMIQNFFWMVRGGGNYFQLLIIKLIIRQKTQKSKEPKKNGWNQIRKNQSNLLTNFFFSMKFIKLFFYLKLIDFFPFFPVNSIRIWNKMGIKLFNLKIVQFQFVNFRFFFCFFPSFLLRMNDR